MRFNWWVASHDLYSSLTLATALNILKRWSLSLEADWEKPRAKLTCEILCCDWLDGASGGVNAALWLAQTTQASYRGVRHVVWLKLSYWLLSRKYCIYEQCMNATGHVIIPPIRGLLRHWTATQSALEPDSSQSERSTWGGWANQRAESQTFDLALWGQLFIQWTLILRNSERS